MSIRVDDTHAAYQALRHQVLALAIQGGWQYDCNLPPSPITNQGIGAVLLCKPGVWGSMGRLLFAQLQPEGVPLTRPQEQWIAALSASIPGLEVHVWRDGDLDDIIATLTAARCYV